MNLATKQMDRNLILGRLGVAIGLLLAAAACTANQSESDVKNLTQGAQVKPLTVIGQVISTRLEYTIAPGQATSELHKICALFALSVDSNERKLLSSDQYRVVGAVEHSYGEKLTEFALVNLDGSAADFWLRCRVAGIVGQARAEALALDFEYQDFPDFVSTLPASASSPMTSSLIYPGGTSSYANAEGITSAIPVAPECPNSPEGKHRCSAGTLKHFVNDGDVFQVKAEASACLVEDARMSAYNKCLSAVGALLCNHIECDAPG